MKTAFVVLVLFLTASAARAQGTISGCITDVVGSRLPGITVTVSDQQSQKQVVTQVSGCYSVTDLAPGRYAVRAAQGGFCPAVTPDVVAVAGEVRTVNFTLMVAPFGGDGPSWVYGGMRYNWQSAEAIVYLRIEEVLETKPWPAPTCGFIRCTEHRARVLAVAKTPHALEATDRFTFLQDYVDSFGGPPYRKGDELVAFLVWNPAAARFTRMGGPPNTLFVRGGRIVAPLDREIDGMEVEQFMAKLRALAK